ncbi:hypothetical protein [Bifidobacterium oedipodis]|uniref:Uncharacterized protein n=1 Tax=Bifidobacterium oedipodis TaxID=2675322 RepID=A0A7Y0ESK4_9BIFI|nr:hypothetical protein [Bifidobacterium sp. DSM 109957]NMM95218.1 hypothetical protein [Bifidobacterium sp. DSM 109957]
MANGVHYLEMVEPIKQLKREWRLEEALVLCMQAVETAENDSTAECGIREPAPWYTEQAAIVLRKLKRPDDEEKLLCCYLDHVPKNCMRRTGAVSIAQRLEKLQAKRRTKWS